MNNRKVYDVSMTIREGMVSWPGDDPVKLVQVKSMADGDRLNQTNLEMSAHTGTHIDAPFHFLDGAAGVDTIPPATLIGPALVVEVRGTREIGREALEKAGFPEGVGRLLLKTDNVDLARKNQFQESYAYLTAGGARYIVDRGIRVMGMDYLSVAEYGKGDEVHRILLTGGVVIIEGLDMRGVPPGVYHMAALPLKIAGCDGAPARVVLFSQ
ncbi:MAG: cyclase family protein [bacterium]|nr:MAG: cyclase family protein [bacterium]